jgi:hypothetical protein
VHPPSAIRLNRSPLDNSVNRKYITGTLSPLRDVSRSSRHVGHGMRWTLRRQAGSFPPDENVAAYGEIVWSWRRDPGATLAASVPPTTGARKAASPGRARISRKTIARGKPGCLGCTCQTRVHSFTTLAHGAAGAVGARLSLRPLFKGRDNEMANLGQTMPRECCWLFEIRISKRECRPGEGRGP